MRTGCFFGGERPFPGRGVEDLETFTVSGRKLQRGVTPLTL